MGKGQAPPAADGNQHMAMANKSGAFPVKESRQDLGSPFGRQTLWASNRSGRADIRAGRAGNPPPDPDEGGKEEKKDGREVPPASFLIPNPGLLREDARQR